MKNSNSRQPDKISRPVPPTGAQKLIKTDIQQPKREELDRTNYRPSSGKKIQSAKNMPPKIPVPKKEYIVEDNMTQSRIYEAKQGLQLLKKKMSNKGLSREIGPANDTNEKPITSLKTVASSKNEEIQYENRNTNMPPKKIEKKASQDQANRTEKPPTSTKTVGSRNNDRTTPQNERKQPPPPAYQEYRDQEMEIPIKPKKDFNAMLEEELRKERLQQKGQTAPKKIANQMSEYPPEDSELIRCRHCERMFGETAIEKHEKICLKVFMSKRKAFDSAAYRAPQVEAIPQQVKPLNPKKQQSLTRPTQQKKPTQMIPSKKQEDIPKWKAASLAFRANLKAAKGVQMTKQQKQASQAAQGLIQCNYCGRKFNDKAAPRHIAFCETKSKQIPKINTTIKKK